MRLLLQLRLLVLLQQLFEFVRLRVPKLPKVMRHVLQDRELRLCKFCVCRKALLLRCQLPQDAHCFLCADGWAVWQLVHGAPDVAA